MDVNHPFQGYALNAVDAKGRVSVPAPFRDLVATRCRTYAPGDDSISDKELGVVLGDACDRLVAYDAIGIRQLTIALTESVADRPAAERRRALAELASGELGSTTTVSFDGAGRLVLPPMLREFAGIQGFALFWGNAQFFEIWEPLKARAAFAAEGDRRKLMTLDYLLRERGLA